MRKAAFAILILLLVAAGWWWITYLDEGATGPAIIGSAPPDVRVPVAEGVTEPVKLPTATPDATPETAGETAPIAVQPATGSDGTEVEIGQQAGDADAETASDAAGAAADAVGTASQAQLHFGASRAPNNMKATAVAAVDAMAVERTKRRAGLAKNPRGSGVGLLMLPSTRRSHRGFSPPPKKSADRGNEAVDVGRDAEVGLVGVPLGVEDFHGVGLADREPQAVHVHRALERGVQPAEIQRQFPVDEEPQVIVAAEGEDLAALIRELRMQLGREVEVVGVALVPEAHAIEGEERAVVVGVRSGS